MAINVSLFDGGDWHVESFQTYAAAGGAVALSANTFLQEEAEAGSYASLIIAGGSTVQVSDQGSPDHESYITYAAAGGLISLTTSPFPSLLDSELPQGSNNVAGSSQIWSLG